MRKIKREQTKRLVLGLVVFAAAVALGMPIGVHAQAGEECRTRDRIWSGLWAGANFDFSSIGECKYRSGDSAQQPQDQQAHPAPTTQSAPSLPHTQQSGLYVGLGDSVAAGAGLPLAAQPVNNDVVCRISPQAYPALVASGLGRSYINSACSGATAGDLVTKQRVNGPNIAAQLDTAYVYGVPAVVSITAGANDVRWADFIRKCFGSECGTRFDDTASRTLIAAMRVKLEYALADIQRRSGEQPPVVVLTGYYNPLSFACASQTTAINSDEINWLNGQVDAMNAAIQSAASKYPFARYVPVDFSGHELCTAEPWIQGQGETAPFHPTARGQYAIAEAVLNSLRVK